MGLFPRNNPTLGSTSDSAVTSDTAGTDTSFLRGLVKMLADVWDATNHALLGRVYLGNQLTGSVLTSTINGSGDGDTDGLAELFLGGIGALHYRTRNTRFNGTTWDREYNNQSLVALASAARTTTSNGTSADLTNYNARALTLLVNVSVVGTGSITPSLQVKDSVSGAYVTVWTAAAALIANGLAAYHFEAGASGGSWTEKLSTGLGGRTFRVVCTHNNANSISYSASVELGV